MKDLFIVTILTHFGAATLGIQRTHTLRGWWWKLKNPPDGEGGGCQVSLVCLSDSLVSSVPVCLLSHQCDYLLILNVSHLRPSVSHLSSVYILPRFSLSSARFTCTPVSRSPAFIRLMLLLHATSRDIDKSHLQSEQQDDWLMR